MNRNALFIGPLRATLLTTSLLVLPSLSACAADTSKPAPVIRTVTQSATKDAGVRVQAIVSSIASDTVQVRLQFEGVSAADGAHVSYSLTGPGQITEQEQGRLPAGQASTRRVTVRLAPGARHYLNVFTRMDGRSGVISIALANGPAHQKPARAAPLTQDGTRRDLVIMPGQLRK